MCDFYQTYFQVSCSAKYENLPNGVSSYYLSLDGSVPIEIMHREVLKKTKNTGQGEVIGLAYFVMSVGNVASIDALTECLRRDGFQIPGEPGITGDGY